MLKAIYQLLSTVLRSIQDGLVILKRIEATVKDNAAAIKVVHAEQASQAQMLGILAALVDNVAVSAQKLTISVDKILAAVEPLPAVRFVFAVDLEGQLTEGATNVDMTNSQQAVATITPVDIHEKPAPIDGVPVWASSDETIVTVAASADGLSALVKAVGPLGSAKVSVTGDADLGADVKPIFGTLDVTITPGLAVGFKITLGDPVEQ